MLKDPLWVVDLRNVGGLWAMSSLDNAKAMLRQALTKAGPGPLARYERLARRLFERLPPSSSTPSLWRDADPLRSVRAMRDPCWKPPVSQQVDGREQVLRELLPLARELHFEVFDLESGAFFPSQGAVFPASLAPIRERLDPAAACATRYGKTMLAAMVAEMLDVALSAHGFVREAHPDIRAMYKRRVEGAVQTIWLRVLNAMPHTRCEFNVDIESERFATLRRRMSSWHSHQPIEACAPTGGYIGMPDLSELRQMQPGWHEVATYDVQLLRSREEAQWLVDDAVGLLVPVLDQARTVRGLNELLNGPEAAATFPQNFHHTGSCDPCWVRLPYARLAGDSQFDALAQSALDDPRCKPPLPSSPTVQDWITFCRECVGRPATRLRSGIHPNFARRPTPRVFPGLAESNVVL